MSELASYDECSGFRWDVRRACGLPEGTESYTDCAGTPGFTTPLADICEPSCSDSRCAAAILRDYCCYLNDLYSMAGPCSGPGCQPPPPINLWSGQFCIGDRLEDVCPPVGCSSRGFVPQCCTSEGHHCGPRPPEVITEP